MNLATSFETNLCPQQAAVAGFKYKCSQSHASPAQLYAMALVEAQHGLLLCNLKNEPCIQVHRC